MSVMGSIQGADDEDENPKLSSAPKPAASPRSNANPEALDFIRHEFLNDLDCSPRIEVTDWEASFMSSNLRRKTFSPAQRNIIDKMRKKYDDKL
jgi:hypothetical protein